MSIDRISDSFIQNLKILSVIKRKRVAALRISDWQTGPPLDTKVGVIISFEFLNQRTALRFMVYRILILPMRFS